MSKRNRSSTITLKGGAANGFMAGFEAQLVKSETEAVMRMASHDRDTPYGRALETALKARGFLKD